MATTTATGASNSVSNLAPEIQQALKGITIKENRQTLNQDGCTISADYDCPANTFSPTYKAGSITQCLACPPDTTSTSGSNNVRSCVCNSGYFVSNNLVSAFDGIISSLGFNVLTTALILEKFFFSLFVIFYHLN
jgi:hypothetical protein